MPDQAFYHALLSATVFGLLGIVLMLLGFKAFDLMTPKIDVQRELAERNNMAVAVVVAAVLISISIIVGRVVSA